MCPVPLIVLQMTLNGFFFFSWNKGMPFLYSRILFDNLNVRLAFFFPEKTM